MMNPYRMFALALAAAALTAGCAGPERESSGQTVIVEPACGFWSWGGCWWWWGGRDRVETRTTRTQESRPTSNPPSAGPAVENRINVTPPSASPAPLVSPAPSTAVEPIIGLPGRR